MKVIDIIGSVVMQFIALKCDKSAYYKPKEFNLVKHYLMKVESVSPGGFC